MIGITHSDPTEAGIEARLSHIPKDDNPYSPGTVAFDRWAEGWDSGKLPDKPKRKYFDINDAYVFPGG